MNFEIDCVAAPYKGPVVLASSSGRRRRLMAEAGYNFRVIVPKLGEDHLHAPTPGMLAESLAYAKARQVSDGLQSGIVIGADTIVACKGEVLGKPVDEADARRILKKLSSTVHEVITGLCVLNARRGERLIGSAVTHIRMRPMTDEEIADYTASGEALGKAGAYAIQETGDRFVESIDGSFTNVVGLPMPLLADYVEAMARLIYKG